MRNLTASVTAATATVTAGSPQIADFEGGEVIQQPVMFTQTGAGAALKAKNN